MVALTGASACEGRRGQSSHAIIDAECAARVNLPTTSQSKTSHQRAKIQIGRAVCDPRHFPGIRGAPYQAMIRELVLLFVVGAITAAAGWGVVHLAAKIRSHPEEVKFAALFSPSGGRHNGKGRSVEVGAGVGRFMRDRAQSRQKFLNRSRANSV